MYFEAITNPLLKIMDVPRLAEIARRHGLRLVIDATFAPPIAMRALEHGADVVVHSASKYLNGHSDLIAGVAAGPRKLIDMVWPEFPEAWRLTRSARLFLLERGLKTLAIRMRARRRRPCIGAVSGKPPGGDTRFLSASRQPSGPRGGATVAEERYRQRHFLRRRGAAMRRRWLW